jgi:hypothetical protein
MAKLLVILPFGPPHVEHKIAILRSNLTVIRQGLVPGPNGRSSAWSTVCVKVLVYSDEVEIPHDLGVDVIKSKGIVGDFFKEFASPAVITEGGFDYVMLLLDDVEIRTQPDWRRLLLIKELSGAHLLTPTLSHDSSNIVYDYTKHVVNAPHTARLLTVAEMFLFLFDSKSYCERYYPLLSKDNPWLWGIDLALFYETGVRPAQVNNWVIRHWYSQTSYKAHARNPEQDMKEYLARQGHTVESLWEKRFVISALHMNHLTETQWESLWTKR